MPQVTARTLQLAIRAIADRVHRLEEQFAREETTDEEAASYTYMELVDYQEAAGDLEMAYDTELRGGALSLIPYDELVAPPADPG